jgi:hypothetical protein
MPTVVATDNAAIVDAERSGGRCVRATLISSGTTATARPCNPRPITNDENGSGNTVNSPPAMTRASVARIVTRRYGPLPSLPRTGPTTAPLNRVTVKVHCAASRDTRIPVATGVMRGAPTLPTTAPANAVHTSAALSRPVRWTETPLKPSVRALIGSPQR